MRRCPSVPRQLSSWPIDHDLRRTTMVAPGAVRVNARQGVNPAETRLMRPIPVRRFFTRPMDFFRRPSGTQVK
jgi:hypothetical protein